MEAQKIVGTLIGVTIIGIGGVWIYRMVQGERRREVMFNYMMERRNMNDPSTRIGGARGYQPVSGVVKNPDTVSSGT